MEQRELRRMIAFALDDSARRLRELAVEVTSPLVRLRLLALARELIDHAGTVARD
jgi:hypothetical protein